jgi:hypothetical protein
MKVLSLLLCLIATVSAQVVETARATLIAPVIREVVPEKPPEPVLQLNIAPESVIESKTVTADGQKITLQEIEPITLPPLPEPLPEKPLTPEQLARRAEFAARAPIYRSLMLSCTVYDGTHTLIRGMTCEKDVSRPWEAWSNINFHHFNSLPRFQKNGITYSLFFGLGEENTVRTAARYARAGKTYTPPAIPKLPVDSTTSPQFIVTKGTPTAEDLAPIIGLHEIYQDHHKDLISEYIRNKALQEKEAAERLATPPDPKPDIVIQHWTVTPGAPPAPTKLIHSETSTREASTPNAEKATR